MNRACFFLRWILLLGLLYFPGGSAASEWESLTRFREQLARIPPTQSAVLDHFGKPKTTCGNAPQLKSNLKQCLGLSPKTNGRYLLDSELHPSFLKKSGLNLNDLNQPSVLNQIDTLWTYDYAGVGKWASFIGVYFNSKKEVLGWDWLVPKEETAKNGTYSLTFHRKPPQTGSEKLGTFLAWPFNLVRGVKQTALELVKAPVNFVEVTWFLGPEQGWHAARQDLQAAAALYRYLIANPSNQNPLDAIHNLLAEIPVFGSWWDDPLSSKVPGDCDAYFLIGGIHQISDTAQRMDLLQRTLEKELNTGRVYQIPWNHGTMLDISFGTMNLSLGEAVILAQKIVSAGNLQPGDRIALFAHSGAIQQVIGAARILRDEEIYVTQAFGVAGVFLSGKAPVREFEIIYNPDVDRFKWLLGFQGLTPGVKWKKVRGRDPSKAHELSGSIDKKNRQLYDGYFSEIITFFKSRKELN